MPNFVYSVTERNKPIFQCFLIYSGGTIPLELLPTLDSGSGEVQFTDINPDFVIVDRQTNHVHIFVISIADESELIETQKQVLEKYYDLVIRV
jgi:hypothetical protein